MSTLFEQDVVTLPQKNPTCLIPLTQGKVAIVDAADYDWLMQWKWHASKDYRKPNWYALRWDTEKSKNVAMHREIVGVPSGFCVDHKNGNGLDNRRGNIRVASSSQNQFNRGKQINNTSGHKGVTWDKHRNVWFVNFRAYKKPVFVGRFRNLDDAIEAYRKACIKNHGAFSRW